MNAAAVGRGRFAVVAALDGRGEAPLALPLRSDAVRVIETFDSEAQADAFILRCWEERDDDPDGEIAALGPLVVVYSAGALQ